MIFAIREIWRDYECFGLDYFTEFCQLPFKSIWVKRVQKMNKKELLVKYSLEFLVIVLGISVSFWLSQISKNNYIQKERIKVLNSLKEEVSEIKDYCLERKKNWQKDINILNVFTTTLHQPFNFETLKQLTKSKGRVQFNLIYYRVFEPPTDRYHAIISSGDLKYVRSDKIKNLLNKIHITYSSYVQTSINYEKNLKQNILPIVTKRHPSLITKKNDNSISFEKYCNLVHQSIKKDSELVSSLTLLKEYQKNKINLLSMYLVLIEDLETELGNSLKQK